MHYKITLEELGDYWTYVLTLDKNTPTTLRGAAEYADEHISAEDKHGIRHYVLLKQKKIVQIQLHHALQIMPHLNPGDPSSLQMPTFHAIMFGRHQVPTLLIVFKEFTPKELAAYALSPNVFLVFDEAEHLARLYVTDVYTVLNDVG